MSADVKGLTTVSLDVFKIFIGHYCTHVPERVIAMERYYCGLIKQRLIIEHIPMVAPLTLMKYWEQTI